MDAGDGSDVGVVDARDVDAGGHDAGGADVGTTDAAHAPEVGDAAFGDVTSPDASAPADSSSALGADAGDAGDAAFEGDANPSANPDGGECAFDRSYSLGSDGGRVAYSDQWSLRPPAAFSLTRTRYLGDAGPSSRTCTTTLVGCGASDAAAPSLGRLVADFGAADVQSAFSASDSGGPLLFGVDQRPADGAVFVVQRDDGRSFQVGAPCQGGLGCIPIPPAVSRLVADLEAVEQAEVASAACSSL